MLFQLLIAAVLVQFCISTHIPDIYWSPSITGRHNTAEEINNKVTPTQSTMRLKKVPEAASISAGPNTVIAEQLSSVPSVETILVKQYQYNNKNYMLASEQKLQIYSGKQHSNEVFKRRVVKMAVPPESYGPQVGNIPTSTPGYRQQAGNLPAGAPGTPEYGQQAGNLPSRAPGTPDYRQQAGNLPAGAPGYGPEATSRAPTSESGQYGLRKM